MMTLDIPPSRHEIVDQLKRMLASARFQAAYNPSFFLNLSVKRALKGEKTTGIVIAQALFGEKYDQLDNADVRVTALNLRKLIARYYEREGATDVVSISLPKPSKDNSVKPVAGEAYTPLFSYNPKHPAYIHLRIGFRFLEQGTYRDYDRAFRLFMGILGEEPDNFGAALGAIEALCKFADRQWEPPFHLHPFVASENLFAHFQGRGETYWRFWATKAYLNQGRGPENTDEARSLYATALKLDPIATEGYLPYIDFLVLIGERDEALGLAQRYFNERVEDSTAVAQYGQWLLCAGETDLGTKHLKAALELDPNNCLAHDTLATFFLIQKNFAEGAFHLRALKSICDDESFSRIVEFLTRDRGEYSLEVSVEQLLLADTNVLSSAIVKL